MKRILVLGTGNSARSQMGAGVLKSLDAAAGCPLGGSAGGGAGESAGDLR